MAKVERIMVPPVPVPTPMVKEYVVTFTPDEFALVKEVLGAINSGNVNLAYDLYIQLSAAGGGALAGYYFTGPTRERVTPRLVRKP